MAEPGGTSAPSDPAFEELLAYVRDSRGFDFTGYKRSSLGRRFETRMQVLRIESYAEYLAYLEANPEEFVELFNAVLINVTSFFRDPPAWDAFQHIALPKMLAGKAVEDPVRVWTVGCASGEEAYTVAMVLCEVLGEDRFRDVVKIYATDVDMDALTHARHAVYPAKDVTANVPADLVGKYFEPDDHGYAFRADLRRCVIFGRHDVIQDPPISRVDVLTCRNTLMYFNTDIQQRILNQFHFSLTPKASSSSGSRRCSWRG